MRERYAFSLIGYVVMPEHIHLLISEPAKGTPSSVMQVLKQRVSRRLRRKSRKQTSVDTVDSMPSVTAGYLSFRKTVYPGTW